MALIVILCVTSCYFITTATGELTAETSLCPGQSALYRCDVNNADLEWQWFTGGSNPQELSVVSNLMPSVTTTSLIIGGTQVNFNITNFVLAPSSISVVATIDNPETLNGVTMTCGGQSLVINIPQTSLLPTTLRISRTSNNKSEVSVHTTSNYNSNIFYRLSSSSTLISWTKPINITVPNVVIYYHCHYNTTFIIDCVLNDINEDRNYTLYSNGTWVIAQGCSPPEMQVTCIDGSWSEDITCQKLTSSPMFEQRTSATTAIMDNVQSPQQCSTSTNKYSLELVIGSVIGSFLLALSLGLVLGLLFGVKFTTTKYLKRQTDSSNMNKNSNKGPLYEEVEMDKNVELTQNISYDTVKSIK